jgi:hypothetical protein
MNIHLLYRGYASIYPDISTEDSIGLQKICNCKHIVKDSKLIILGEKWKITEVKELFVKILNYLKNKNYELHGALYCHTNVYGFDPINVLAINNGLQIECTNIDNNIYYDEK